MFHSCFLLSVWWKLCAWHISKVYFPQSLPRALFHVLASLEAKELHQSVWSCSQVWFWPHNLGVLHFRYSILRWNCTWLLTFTLQKGLQQLSQEFYVLCIPGVGVLVGFFSAFFPPSTKSQISNNLSLNLKRCSFSKIYSHFRHLFWWLKSSSYLKLHLQME